MVQGVTIAVPVARANALLDRVEWHAIEGATALCGHGVIDAYHVAVFATDPAYARGALGVRDGEALRWTLRHARDANLPMVWLLDSAGAKVDEGLPALAAFRRFYREALEARAAGVRIIALLGRGCWGGASLLAMLAELRVFTPRTRFATSGPAVIEAVEGKAHFDAANPTQIDALVGAAARAAMDTGAVLAEESEHRSLLMMWLSGKSRAGRPFEWRDSTASGHHDAFDQIPRLQSLLPSGWIAEQSGNVVYALPPAGSSKVAFCGYLGGGTIGVGECVSLLRVLETIATQHALCPIILTLDAAGHAATLADERLILARYLDAVGNRVLALRHAGHRISLWIPGSASGAVYVVFAAPVDSVSVLPSARVEVLAAKAVDRILGRAVQGASSAQELVTLGIADAVLDERLMGYPGT